MRVEHEQDTTNAKLHKYILKVISGNTTWWCGSLLARTDDRRTGGDTGGVDGCRHTVLRRAFVELDRVHERVGKIFRVTHYKYAFLCGISIICVYYEMYVCCTLIHSAESAHRWNIHPLVALIIQLR